MPNRNNRRYNQNTSRRSVQNRGFVQPYYFRVTTPVESEETNDNLNNSWAMFIESIENIERESIIPDFRLEYACNWITKPKNINKRLE